MKDGILILNKTQDWTSHDCVAVCRRVLRLKGVKKIGHGGTLDPMACGVLPIYIGKATRLMEYTDLDSYTPQDSQLCAFKEKLSALGVPLVND